MPITEKDIRELIVFYSHDEKAGVEVFDLVRRKTDASAGLILRLIKDHYPKLVPSLVLAKILPAAPKAKHRLNRPKRRRVKSKHGCDIYDLPNWKRRGGYTF